MKPEFLLDECCEMKKSIECKQKVKSTISVLEKIPIGTTMVGKLLLF